jgi:predicted RNA-binding Zn-ribbon protein involved in translation (DUF1610 family)
MVKVSCPKCGTQNLDPATAASLVKVPGLQTAVIYECPGCSVTRRQEVHEQMIGLVSRVFREAGRPLVFLPSQGDLPWPPLSSDDLIEMGLHMDEILDELANGGPDE